ncbi:hypothetical protein IWQ61_006586 [Dispira simplex]|nr:hypothetical protein IWQ61_006586 [Dispira simplex]
MDTNICPRCYRRTEDDELYCSEVCKYYDGIYDYPNPPPPTLVQRGEPAAVAASLIHARPAPKPIGLWEGGDYSDLRSITLPNIHKLELERRQREDEERRQRIEELRNHTSRGYQDSESEPEDSDSDSGGYYD